MDTTVVSATCSQPCRKPSALATIKLFSDGCHTRLVTAVSTVRVAPSTTSRLVVSQTTTENSEPSLAAPAVAMYRPLGEKIAAVTSPCTNILAWSTRQMWHDSHFLFGVWRSPPQTSSWQQEGSKFSLRPYMDKRFCPITIVFMQRWDHSDHQRGGSHRVRSASRWEQFP